LYLVWPRDDFQATPTLFFITPQLFSIGPPPFFCGRALNSPFAVCTMPPNVTAPFRASNFFLFLRCHIFSPSSLFSDDPLRLLVFFSTHDSTVFWTDRTLLFSTPRFLSAIYFLPSLMIGVPSVPPACFHFFCFFFPFSPPPPLLCFSLLSLFFVCHSSNRGCLGEPLPPSPFTHTYLAYSSFSLSPKSPFCST